MVSVANLQLRDEMPKGAHENVLKAIGGVLNYSVGGDTAIDRKTSASCTAKAWTYPRSTRTC